MIRSVSENAREFDLLRDPKHVATVAAKIDEGFERYFDSWLAKRREDPALAEVRKKFGNHAPAKGGRKDGEVLREIFAEAIEEYGKRAELYQKLFDANTVQEYVDVDPAAFKTALIRECPIIAATIRSQRPELVEWHKRFKMAKPKELLTLFSNLMEFREDYEEQWPEKAYGALRAGADFRIDKLDDERDYRVAGVIGMGIKSAVLYHLDPRRFPYRDRGALYALYFLSGRGDFGMPSKSSEFLMVNDDFTSSEHNVKMDQNYWYPYGYFTALMVGLLNRIQKRCEALDIKLDTSYRYVYLRPFFDHIWEEHRADIETMMCIDETDRRWR